VLRYARAATVTYPGSGRMHVNNRRIGEWLMRVCRCTKDESVYSATTETRCESHKLMDGEQPSTCKLVV
jgi:hypothetical protein